MQWIIRIIVFNVYITAEDIKKYNQIERRDEKPKHQRQFFQNLDNFYI